jgi:acetyltransferase-like isoleucine patch superfamily enzyme
VIRLGRSVRINSGPDQNYVGGDRQTNIWIAPGALLEIGDEAAISNSTIIARCSVRIGMQAYIGGGCDIYDNDFHELQPEDRICKRGNIGSLPIEIGPKTFIGGHSIILKGVTIGEGAVVGAGSLVTKSIPQYEIWAGRPARFIRKIVLKSDATCLTR